MDGGVEAVLSKEYSHIRIEMHEGVRLKQAGMNLSEKVTESINHEHEY